MYKLFFYSLVSSVLICLYGCKREKQYTIGLPIENCSMVSYDNHSLTDNGVNIYCPSGSPVVAAMDGIVESVSKIHTGWLVETINQANDLISQYSVLNPVYVSEGDVISMYDTIGCVASEMMYLRYVLYQPQDKDTVYLNPLPKFNECFR